MPPIAVQGQSDTMNPVLLQKANPEILVLVKKKLLIV